MFQNYFLLREVTLKSFSPYLEITSIHATTEWYFKNFERFSEAFEFEYLTLTPMKFLTKILSSKNELPG